MRIPTLPPTFRMPYATDDTRTCYRCGYETTEPLDRCAECGYRLRTGRAVRRLGWVLVALGGALVACMGYLSLVVAQIIYRTEAGRPGGTTFSGDAEDAALIYGVFGFVAALGAGIIFGGAWQIRYGRPNRKVVAVAFAVVVLLLLGRRVLRLLNTS